MSTTSIRDRVKMHHVTPTKNWFGVLFAVPLGSALHCPAIEAEMIRRIEEAAIVPLVENKADEKRWLDADDVHVAPAVDSITLALEMLLGNDIFLRLPTRTNRPLLTRSRRRRLWLASITAKREAAPAGCIRSTRGHTQLHRSRHCRLGPVRG